MLGREFSWFARVSMLQRGLNASAKMAFDGSIEQCPSLVSHPFLNLISFLSPGPPGYSKLSSFAHRTTVQNVPNIANRILMSDPWSRVGVFGQTGPFSLEQPDLRGNDTFVYPPWMLCFGTFADLGHQQHNIALAVFSSPFYPPLWELFWHQSDVRGWCHVVFWPRDSNTIFEGKMTQLWRLVKSLLVTPDVSNFGFAYLTRYILKLNKNKFHFIGTLIGGSFIQRGKL